MWDLDDGGFAGVVLLKKGAHYAMPPSSPSHKPKRTFPVIKPETPADPSGSWDSIHVFEASERGRTAHYKLTSTVMLHIIAGKTVIGKEGGDGASGEAKADLSGSLTRQVSSTPPPDVHNLTTLYDSILPWNYLNVLLL